MRLLHIHSESEWTLYCCAVLSLQYCSWTHCGFLSANVLDKAREGSERDRTLIYSVEQQEVASVKVNNFKNDLLMQQLHALIFITLQTCYLRAITKTMDYRLVSFVLLMVCCWCVCFNIWALLCVCLWGE